LVIVVIALVVGYLPMMPPSTVGDEAPADLFSADRAAAHVRVIAREPHPLGSPAIAEVRGYIGDQLSSLGIAFETQAFFRPDMFVPNRTAEIVNVIGRIQGTDSTGAIALIGHYDTVPQTPGANDNTAAVATLLEIGRALQTGSPLRNDVILLFTDAEEPFVRYGSTTFVEQHPAFSDIALAVNFEANGRFGASLLAEVSGAERWMVGELNTSGAGPAAFSFVTQTSRWVGDFGTDFDKFRNAGVPGFHFAYLHGSSIYHTDGDNIQALSEGSMQHHGNQGLAVARHFGSLDLSEDPPEGGAVFFRLFGRHVQYPAWLAIPLLLIALGVFAAAFVRGRIAPPHRPATGFAFGAAGLLLATMAWIVVTNVRSTLGLVEGYVYYAILVGLVALGIYAANRRFRPESTRGSGSVVALIMLALATSLVAQGFSYLFVWPALAIAVAALVPPGNDWQALLRFGLVAFVTIVLLTPAADVFLQFAHPRPGNPDSDLGPAVVLPIGIALLSIGLLRQFWPVDSRTVD
jgi:hypothetical protein